MSQSKRKEIYSMTISPELVEKAARIAAEQDKSFSKFVSEAIENYIKLIESKAKS